jgi:AcrR family transcriptional regulator
MSALTEPAAQSVILARPRRTQAERSASTRSRLLDATLQCLIEQGYARTTTAQIEARAEVSRGARLHHFPNKAALLSAAVEHLFVGISERYRAAMARVAPDADRFRAGFRLLWETYVDPSYAAVLELCNAARTDAELRDQLRGLSTRHHQLVRRRANEYFPSLARREASGLLETLQATLTGLAVRRMVYGESVDDDQVLDLIEGMVERVFATNEEITPT